LEEGATPIKLIVAVDYNCYAYNWYVSDTGDKGFCLIQADANNARFGPTATQVCSLNTGRSLSEFVQPARRDAQRVARAGVIRSWNSLNAFSYSSVLVARVLRVQVRVLEVLMYVARDLRAEPNEGCVSGITSSQVSFVISSDAYRSTTHTARK
jgi:hypothetical protein